MNKFELFCMIFYVLDAEWDETKDMQLGEYLSAANPFLFDDIGSADPTVYADFCATVTEPIRIEDSYDIACNYVNKNDNAVVRTAFSSIEKKDWLEFVQDYLSREHKGM